MDAEELITLALIRLGRENSTAAYLGSQGMRYVANVILERGKQDRDPAYWIRTFDEDPFRSYWDFGLNADERANSFTHQLVEDMPLCPRLCGLFAHLSDLKADAAEKNEKAPNFLKGLVLFDIIKDAVKNCPAAKLVVETIRSHVWSGLGTVEQYVDYLQCFMEEVCIIFKQEHDAIELWFREDRKNVEGKWNYKFAGVIDIFANTGQASIGTYQSVNIVLTKDLENPSASYITRRPVDACPVSPFNLSFIRNSLSNCLDNHRNCHNAGQYHDPQLPTRVIDIGSSIKRQKGLKLVTLAGRQDRYATLSYCWGGSQEFCTTKTTMMRNMESMDHDQLPKTIRDAIWVTRELGIRYLWVDSLCIVQDDTEDKNREIAKMADIYSDSTITISAAAATTCHDGFLNGKCTADERESCQFALPSLKTQGRQTFFCLGEGEHLSCCYKSKRWPTDRRAWTYQEEFLSPRLIHFFEDGFRWSCRFGSTSNNQDAARGIGYLFGKEVLIRQAIFRNENGISKPHRDAMYEAWRTMTVEISRRSLSYSTDRLPSISAVAERVSKALGDEPYLAGIWKCWLRQGLMWHCVASAAQGFERPPGPSWSWASTGGAVYVMHIEIDENETLPPLNLREVDLRLMSPIVPFGAVHSARLSLSAPLRYLDPSFCGRHMGIRYGQRSLPDHHLLGKLGFVSVDNEQFDMAWWRQHSPPVVFLKLARGDHIEDLGKVYGEIGLVLINDPNVNAPEKLNFMRVGMYGILTTAHGRTQSWRLEQLQEWDATEPVDLVDFDLV